MMGAGDDFVEFRFTNQPAKYVHMKGFKMEFHETDNESFEFCSSRFSAADIATTNNAGKILMNYFTGDKTPEQQVQLYNDLRHSKDLIRRLREAGV
jgi:hypothetical protein